VVHISIVISFSIITPITRLLALLQQINRKNIKHNLPTFESSSKEVSQVYNAFDQLYKVVRFANTAFLAGDLNAANNFLTDALELFKQLNNSKAIGIANNNLGNTMLTMYRTLQRMGEYSICGMSKYDIVVKGKSYFDASIDLGEEAIARINDEEGWSTNYLLFMQQLSNRYFNRAMFLLVTRDDYEKSGLLGDAVNLGFTDLKTSQDMDIEVVDNGDQVGYKGNKAVYFSLLLGRIRGILLLMKMSLPDKWGIEDMFDSAVELVVAARKDPEENVLFNDVAFAGRMQELDALIIDYFSCIKKDTKQAARIGIRMLIEDEYVLPDAALGAITALKKYTEENTVEMIEGGHDVHRILGLLQAYSSKLENTPIIVNMRRNISIAESRRGDITMEKI